MSEVAALALDTCTALRTYDDTGIAAPCTPLKCDACDSHWACFFGEVSQKL